MPPSHIAVLGGGLTGLSSAFYLSRRFPSSRITLLEKSSRCGGWIRSERVRVPLPSGDNASVLLEMASRTLRPQSKVLVELINLLGLQDRIVYAPQSAARNRFIYIPPAYKEKRLSGLIKLPSTVGSVLTSPLRSTILPAALSDFLSIANQPLNQSDESFDSVLERRFSPDLARILGSSLVHGIYAADSRHLSVASAFPSLIEAQKNGAGSIVRGLLRTSLKKRSEVKKEEKVDPSLVFSSVGLDSPLFDFGEVEEEMQKRKVAVFSFKEGIQSITDALERRIIKNNVELRKNTDVTSVKMGKETQDSNFEITTNTDTLHPSHVVSTLPLNVLCSIFGPESDMLPSYLYPYANYASSVTVINLVFPSPPPSQPPLHPDGFGMLVPRPPSNDYVLSADSPNPLGVLGVVFDSSAVGEQDEPRDKVVKMTVMLGGPYYAYTRAALGPSAPKNGSGIEAPNIPDVLAFLSTAFLGEGQKYPEPLYTRVTHHKECIPFPLLGHPDMVKNVSTGVDGKTNGRMEVIGAAFTGVSLGDCAAAGREVGRKWQ